MEGVVAVIQQHTQLEKEGRERQRGERGDDGKGERGEKGGGREGGEGGCCNTATYSTGEEALAVNGERTNNNAIIKLFWKLLAHY